MVNWIDEPEDADEDDEQETFTCPSCESELAVDMGATCPVCGEPLDDADADAEAVAHLEAAYEERTETDYEGA